LPAALKEYFRQKSPAGWLSKADTITAAPTRPKFRRTVRANNYDPLLPSFERPRIGRQEEKCAIGFCTAAQIHGARPKLLYRLRLSAGSAGRATGQSIVPDFNRR